jgi:glutathione peroxidase
MLPNTTTTPVHLVVGEGLIHKQISKQQPLYMLKLFISIAFVYLSGIYDLTLQGADGATINLNDFKGKKILLVNIATSSKYVSQFAGLEQLSQKYKDSLVVIAVPSNSFGHEQKSNAEIVRYLNEQYHIHFLVAGKVGVTGNDQSQVFRWLTHSNQNGEMDNTINSDFWKFLIDENGNLLGTFVSSVQPMNDAIQSAIHMHN